MDNIEVEIKRIVRPPMRILPEPVRADSLSRQVFCILKDAVFQGKFKPGEQLPEIQVARWLNVSQATVREALALMEQSGLVVRFKNRKTQVAKLTREDVLDRLAMCSALEPKASVRAAAALDTDDFAELDEKVRVIERMPEEGGAYLASMAHLEFHQLIWEKTNSPILIRTLEHLTTPLFAFLKHEHSGGVDPHRTILEALRSGDEAAIEQAVQADIDSTYNWYFNLDRKCEIVSAA